MQLKPEPLALAVISTWEAVALLTGRVPTVTTITMRLSRPVRTVLIGAVGYWLIDHFELRPHDR